MIGVRCTDNRQMYRRRKKKRNRQAAFLSALLIVLCFIAGYLFYADRNDQEEFLVQAYESANYNTNLYRAGSLFAEDLCVASGDVAREGVSDMSGTYAGALFDVNDRTVAFAYNMHQRLYPASTTKILTALVAIRNGNLEDIATVSVNASSASFAADESVCGILEGDQLTLKDLVYGLILQSGNDNAVAIAEHIAGSEEAFVEMMNEQAMELMATNSHFMNSNGLHNEDHYTTAYDLYLIFNACITHPEFIEIIQSPSYTAHVTRADGSATEMVWEPTHFYASGRAAAPTGAAVVGGKTGFTDQAGSCLILLDVDAEENPYISVVMGASSKGILYDRMTAMIDSIL